MSCIVRVLTIHYQLIPFSFNFTLEATMGGIILEHINHVVQSNEWIIDGNNLKNVGCIYDTVQPTTWFIFNNKLQGIYSPQLPFQVLPSAQDGQYDQIR
jgi:hypothetical protein